jgi:hypothetical protein
MTSAGAFSLTDKSVSLIVNPAKGRKKILKVSVANLTLLYDDNEGCHSRESPAPHGVQGESGNPVERLDSGSSPE